jgi:hypothetical protein
MRIFGADSIQDVELVEAEESVSYLRRVERAGRLVGGEELALGEHPEGSGLRLAQLLVAVGKDTSFYEVVQVWCIDGGSFPGRTPPARYRADLPRADLRWYWKHGLPPLSFAICACVVTW